MLKRLNAKRSTLIKQRDGAGEVTWKEIVDATPGCNSHRTIASRAFQREGIDVHAGSHVVQGLLANDHTPSYKPCGARKEFVPTVQTAYKPSYKPCTPHNDFVQTVQAVV